MNEVLVPAVISVIIAAVVTVVGGLVTGYWNRGNVVAQTRATDVSADIAQSAEAREWTRVAVARMRAAEEKADRLQERMTLIEEYVDMLELIIRAHNIPVPPPPWRRTGDL